MRHADIGAARVPLVKVGVGSGMCSGLVDSRRQTMVDGWLLLLGVTIVVVLAHEANCHQLIRTRRSSAVFLSSRVRNNGNNTHRVGDATRERCCSSPPTRSGFRRGGALCEFGPMEV